MIDKIVFIYKYLSVGRFIACEDEVDTLILQLLQRNVFSAVLSLLIVALSLALFYFFCLKFLRVFIKNKEKSKLANLIKRVGPAKTSGIILLIVFVVLAFRQSDYLKPNQVEGLAVGFLPADTGECRSRKYEKLRNLITQVTRKPWTAMNEADYRQLKNEYDSITCPSEGKTRPVDFSKAEAELDEMERGRLKARVLEWGIGVGIFLAVSLLVRFFRFRSKIN